MPPYDTLGPEDLDALVTYLRTLGEDGSEPGEAMHHGTTAWHHTEATVQRFIVWSGATWSRI